MDENRIGGGFTEGELQVASFWVQHRLLLRKLLYGSLIGLNAIFWGYAAWGLLDAYAISYPREARIPSEIAQNQFLAAQLEQNRPASVSVGEISVFQGTDERLDFLVQAANPNTNWWADFTYRFNVSGEDTPSQSGFLLPGEQTYLGTFGFKPATKGARSGVLTVDNLRWHRIDPSVVGGDYAAWAGRRKAFNIKDVAYASDLDVAGKKFSRTSFVFQNASAYGYWSVKLFVVLKRAAAPVAATTITLEQVKAGESRPVAIDWFERLPAAISETEVISAVNLLDESVYLSQ